jgi:hypothetical protein
MVAASRGSQKNKKAYMNNILDEINKMMKDEEEKEAKVVVIEEEKETKRAASRRRRGLAKKDDENDPKGFQGSFKRKTSTGATKMSVDKESVSEGPGNKEIKDMSIVL